MSLIVEDGTGRSDAESFISVADAKAYYDARGFDYSAYSDEQFEEALRRSSTFLTFAFIWQGQKVNRRAQALAWPRYSMTDRENWPVLPTEIPIEVKNACCEVAKIELTEPGTMEPSVTLSDTPRSIKAGSVSIEYANLFTSPNASRPVLTAVTDYLWPFLQGGSGNSLVGQAYRSG